MYAPSAKRICARPAASVRMVSPLSSSAPLASGRWLPSAPEIVVPPEAKSTRPAAAPASAENAAEMSVTRISLRVRRKGADLPTGISLALEALICARLSQHARRLGVNPSRGLSAGEGYAPGGYFLNTAA